MLPEKEFPQCWACIEKDNLHWNADLGFHTCTEHALISYAYHDDYMRNRDRNAPRPAFVSAARVGPAPKKRHEHADCIIAWANGHTILTYSVMDHAWYPVKYPTWSEAALYKVAES